MIDRLPTELVEITLGDQPSVRFIMIGGFLGAGKTTAIGRLAGHYVDHGHKVGIVTNDQAYDLVDTHSLRASGFHVGEVPGACFCCKFDDLVTTAKKLDQEQHPDTIIAEPVGSCTDLMATVIEPLRHLHGDQYRISPLAVLCKPEHGMKILRGESSGFSPKAAYIFLKQLEEADVVAINKIDKLSKEQLDELLSLVAGRFPKKRIIGMSAKHGDGLNELIELLDEPAPDHERFMDVDYDIYAAGEAELAWLNCTVKLSTESSEPITLDAVAVQLVKNIRDELVREDLEPAHLKVLAQDSEGHSSLANLVSTDVDVDLSVDSTGNRSSSVEITVNARVVCSPEQLETIVHGVIQALASERKYQRRLTNMQRFRPGRPVPIHRFSGDEPIE